MSTILEDHLKQGSVVNLKLDNMKNNKSKMYKAIHSLRKQYVRGGVNIDTRNRTIYYEYQKEENIMSDKKIIMLCLEFGFARQAELRG